MVAWVWVVLGALGGVIVGFVAAALTCAASRADETLTYDAGFKAGYDQARDDEIRAEMAKLHPGHG